MLESYREAAKKVIGKTRQQAAIGDETCKKKSTKGKRPNLKWKLHHKVCLYKGSKGPFVLRKNFVVKNCILQLRSSL